VATKAQLVESLRWVMRAWLDDTTTIIGLHMPDHYCEFETDPEKGACLFHEEWFTAAERCGLLKDWAEDDMRDANEPAG
jgi:hypothetical protein